MKLHANAPLGPKGRALMVRRVIEEGWSLTEAAEAAGASERTLSKWVDRYQRRRPGELLHIDVKKLVRIGTGAGHRMTGKRTKHARGIGWEFVHVCVDDATRLAYVEVLGDEKARTAIGFLHRAAAFYRA